MAKLQKLAEWLERHYPAAAASPVEELEECLTLNRLGLPTSLRTAWQRLPSTHS